MTQRVLARRGATAAAVLAIVVAVFGATAGHHAGQRARHASQPPAGHTGQPPAGHTGQPPASKPPPSPIHLVSATFPDSRTIDMVVSTAALTKPVHVAVLLPANYAHEPYERYPVIYFLGGGSAGPNTGLEYLQWLASSPLEQLTANLPVISVMPQADSGGWYTDWFNGGLGGPPEWETFHVDQLVPFIDQTFRTLPDRGGRALVGLSMGGYGVMEYASRHPDLFGTAVSFSGAVDIANPPQVTGPLASGIIGTMAAGDGGTPDSPFGNFTANQINWRNHDPADLIANLRNTNLYLYTGNGQPGPLDLPGTVSPFLSSIEQIVGESTDAFAALLAQAHVPAFVDNYGPGIHTWTYWNRDLQDALPRIMQDLTYPSPLPKTVTYTTADPTYSRWGWTVTMLRPAEEFSTLVDAGAAGFELSGSGLGTVVTAPQYPPRSITTVTIDGTDIHMVDQLLADGQGRLTIAVPLGPGNPYPQYSSQAVASGGTKVFTTTVHIAVDRSSTSRRAAPHR